jgi:ABC-2 type transport system ATP-binding protein
VKIDIQNLSKWYGQVIGVNNVSCTLGPGVTGFLGPNGAGKTTLLKLMTGQIKSSQGKIKIEGEEVWNNPGLFKKVGYCPEQDAFWDFFSGRDFIFLLTRMYGYSRVETSDLTQKALQMVDMEKYQDKPIGSYSKGMRQRIKLAQAIAHDPNVLFLDEPLNGMDPVARRIIIDLIKRFGKENKTVIVSSHVLHEIEEMTDAILLINHGRLLAHGNIFEIRQLIDTHPLQVTIGCNNVNVLTSKLLEFEDVLSIHLNRKRNQLTVETNRPVEFHRRLPQVILENGIDISSIWSPDENLQAIFDYLVK